MLLKNLSTDPVFTAVNIFFQGHSSNSKLSLLARHSYTVKVSCHQVLETKRDVTPAGSKLFCKRWPSQMIWRQTAVVMKAEWWCWCEDRRTGQWSRVKSWHKGKEIISWMNPTHDKHNPGCLLLLMLRLVIFPAISPGWLSAILFLR